MSIIIVPSSHTGIGAWVNSKMYTNSILYNIINWHAWVSRKHRIHGKLGLQLSLKKNQSTPRPSGHPPVMGGKMSKRLGGIKGCKYKTS